MPKRKETLKYTFTVEGETEKWYLEWLANEINNSSKTSYKVSIISKVQQHPSKFIKSQSIIFTPTITHICDVESNDLEHEIKFKNILDQIDKANNLGKKIKYNLGYSNFTFELWISLHKVNCNGPLTNRSQYLQFINKAFCENFEDLDHYKKENNFKRCLSKLNLEDVKTAIDRSKNIMKINASDPDKKIIKYKKFEYYLYNPSLTIREAIDKILKDCSL